jgi:regulator of protease activity HflC (stomatin/prohibitin superfamily)
MCGVATFLGSAYDHALQPGLTFINPFASVTKLSTQTQIFHFADYVPTMEGVNVYLEATCLMHLLPSNAVDLYKHVGEDYTPIVLIPQLEATVREVTSDHTAAALYTAAARNNMTSELRIQLNGMVSQYGLTIESTPISKLTLPPTIVTAIERKMTLQQEAQAMDFVLQREAQEAQRKIIEAEGIATQQHIIVSNTTDGMMRWNSIQATEEVAKSCGAKIVLLGENGLPMIHAHKPHNDQTPAGQSPNITLLNEQLQNDPNRIDILNEDVLMSIIHGASAPASNTPPPAPGGNCVCPNGAAGTIGTPASQAAGREEEQAQNTLSHMRQRHRHQSGRGAQ